jgi:DNA helicase HerA-like ATPase
MSTDQSELGLIVSTNDSPNTNFFYFLFSKEKVKKGQYIFVINQDSKIFAQINEIFWSNQLFNSHQAIADYSNSGGLENLPLNEWEYGIARAKIIGSLKNENFERCFFPPKCGQKVFLAIDSDLKKIFKFEKNGIFLGNLLHHDTHVQFNLSKLIGKHLSILAMSGAGKSYFTSVLIEELLKLKPEDGRISIIVFDSHKDYTFFENSKFKDQVLLINAKKLKLSYLSFSLSKISSITGMTPNGQYEFLKYISKIKKDKKENNIEPPTLDELILKISEDNSIKKNIKDPLIASLSKLNDLKVFSNSDSFKIKLVKPGKLIIFDLSDIDSLQVKQILVEHYLRKLFIARRKEKIPPSLIIIEEAHNFCPEREREENALSRDIINTIAREGRKFFFSLCLISQRPVNLSKTALSQCNSNVFLRITNPLDLDHIKESSEGIDYESLSFVPGLEVGSALITGEVVRFPIFLKVRKRETIASEKEKTFQQAALEYEKLQEQKNKEAEAYL